LPKIKMLTRTAQNISRVDNICGFENLDAFKIPGSHPYRLQK